jgi:hypothetical protein
VVAFIICWAPFHAQRLLFVYGSLAKSWTPELRLANDALSYIAGQQHLSRIFL